MAAEHCICRFKMALDTNIKGCLLTHPQELSKFKNTGKLVLQQLPSIERELWQRKYERQCLTKAKFYQRQAVLVFPDEYLAPEVKTVEPSNSQYWIVIDSTWQQAKKIVRQSPELQVLPRLSLKQTQASRYRLRRNQTESGLSTLEVFASLLASIGEHHNAEQLLRYFEVFMAAYENQRNDAAVFNR